MFFFSADLAKSALTVKQEAMAAVSDGLGHHHELERLAAAGGKHPQNCERAVLTMARRELGMKLQPLKITVPQYVKRTGKIRLAKAGVMCPHEIWSVLRPHPKFHQLFGTKEEWSRFWHLVREEVWFREHALHDAIAAKPENFSPMLVHIDDAPVTRRIGRNFRAVNMLSPFAANDTARKGVFPLAVSPNDVTMNEIVQERMDETVAWSFNCCATNSFDISAAPGFIDFDQKRLLQSACCLIESDELLVYAGLIGDWMMMALDFDMPCHYNKWEICMLDCACKGGVNNFVDFRLSAPWAHMSRTLAEYFAAVVGAGKNLHPFTKIPGFHTFNFFEDQLHCDALGGRQHANGTILRDLSIEGHFGPHYAGPGNWNTKLDTCLGHAFKEFQVFLKRNRLVCSQPLFKTLALSMHHPDDYPCLKSKGRNSCFVTEWLLEKTKAISEADPTNTIAQQRFALMWGLHGLFDLPNRIKPRWELTALETSELEAYRLTALLSYSTLSRARAEAPGVERGFNMIPKLHATDHMCRRSIKTSISAALFWCFKTEHVMGELAKACGRTHASTTMIRVLQRWLVDFYLWLEESAIGFSSKIILAPHR